MSEAAGRSGSLAPGSQTVWQSMEIPCSSDLLAASAASGKGGGGCCLGFLAHHLESGYLGLK